MGLPGGASGKEPVCFAGNVRDMGSIPGLGRSLGEGHTTESSILAWRMPWTEEHGRLQSLGLQRVRQISRHTCKHNMTKIKSLYFTWYKFDLPYHSQKAWLNPCLMHTLRTLSCFSYHFHFLKYMVGRVYAEIFYPVETICLRLGLEPMCWDLNLAKILLGTWTYPDRLEPIQNPQSSNWDHRPNKFRT